MLVAWEVRHWDNLVVSSRQDDISAAVVFLPEGSEHYGFHDPIPGKHDLRDLHGECWCTGALSSMANGSHGAADGGPSGLRTLSRRFHRNAPLLCIILTALEARAKSKTSPRLGKKICAAKPFSVQGCFPQV